MFRLKLIVLPILCAFIGFVLALAVGPWKVERETERDFPLPHHIPKYSENLTLRFAMVHDVIHERFPVHGEDYYLARNREVREALKKIDVSEIEKGAASNSQYAKTAKTYFSLIDDLAVGLERVGQHQEACDLLREKLKTQHAFGYYGQEPYSTYANLGTVLVLWQLSEGVADVAKARERIGESVKWIRKAIEVYPQSHFGREQWQVVLEEFLLAVLDDPQLLVKHDMVGDWLDRDLDPNRQTCFDRTLWFTQKDFDSSRWDAMPAAQLADQYLKGIAHVSEPNLRELRNAIVLVGAEGGWNNAVGACNQSPVPFDEPALAIVGMWRLGAGANPHFAIALGEIMLRVGQRYIAWTAYERAYRMKESIWPDPQIQKRFGEICRSRQQLIETALPKENWSAIRDKFNKELQMGQNYQKEYRDFEVAQIKAGVATDDPHFYDAFNTAHAPIATPVGAEDTLTAPVKGFVYMQLEDRLPLAIFCAGLGALLAAGCQFLVAWMFARARSQRSTS